MEEVYMKVPQGMVVTSSDLVCKLNKCLYGLKQASRQWYDKLSDALHSKGFQHSKNDYSLFFKHSTTGSVYLGFYVDDIVLIGNYIEGILHLKQFLDAQCKIKDLGSLHYFLGLEVMYVSDGILVNQRKFALELVEEFGCTDSKPTSSPLALGLNLSSDVGSLLSDPSLYRRLIGKLNFLTHTRPDMAYTVQHLSQFMQTPRQPHLDAALHTVCYIKGLSGLGLHFSSHFSFSMVAFCDLDWASCRDSRRSVSGFLVTLGSCPISWKSKKQTTVSLSSAGAECRSVRRLSAIQIAKNPVFHERTKHIELDCHFVREKLQDGLISLHYIPSSAQLADIFTKSLPSQAHLQQLSKLGVGSSSPTSNLRGCWATIFYT
ncbi:PREDICTED: uncharacterized protein LOC109209517 [Nicotiana attenuata]|uniref:uncharacterized protein LOC109209517 n=1 Tax=Nicotiana attenuata TaxID=49451 RepID=UPI00090491DA|nr:PREDICTED: uncharacterized protein LOC109209517 [Nicotiana attenuata]